MHILKEGAISSDPQQKDGIPDSQWYPKSFVYSGFLYKSDLRIPTAGYYIKIIRNKHCQAQTSRNDNIFHIIDHLKGTVLDRAVQNFKSIKTIQSSSYGNYVTCQFEHSMYMVWHDKVYIDKYFGNYFILYKIPGYNETIFYFGEQTNIN